MSLPTETSVPDSSGAGTTTESLGCAGCTRALCSWSLAFWGLFLARFFSRPTPRLWSSALASPDGADIRLALMNEAIRPGPQNPPQAIALPALSVVVPSSNDRHTALTLFRRLETALAGIPFEVIFVDYNPPHATPDLLPA